MRIVQFWKAGKVSLGILCGISVGWLASPLKSRAVDVVAVSPDGAIQTLSDLPAAALAAEPWIRPGIYQPVRVVLPQMRATLALAPMEFSAEARQVPLILSLPMPDGSFARFEVVESPVMAPELAAKFPEIKTYLGRGIDDPAAALRCDVTPAGFHAQVLSPNGAVYIDPLSRGDVEHYASYYKRDYLEGDRGFRCLVGTDEAPEGLRGQDLIPQAPEHDHDHDFAAPVTSGDVLRTYRLAVAATGEYTQFHGGTVAAGMAAIVTAVNRVTGVYEVEVAVRMELVPNNDLVVYTNGATDPYTNNNGGTMLGQNQTNLNNVIGFGNYDVGHVFSTGGGGVANLAVICSSSKARGVTGLPSPTGDPFYIDYVAHEMGHQFGGNHSFNGINGSCSGGNRNGPTAYEPGSGSTIMAYAGICGVDNLQPNSDPYFHFINYQEIRTHVTGTGGVCSVQTSTGNTPPTVNAGPNYTIPRQTPFILTATGNDVDGDTLTFNWEERDLGAAQALSAADNGASPLLRSWNATTSPSRVIPRLSNLVNNTLPVGEKLPNTDRLMRFRVMARDNRAGGGGVETSDMQITVTTASGPFQVTSPNTNVTWGGVQTVTWNTAGTTSAPVNCSSVDITLSQDGGFTYPHVLATATPNDGSEQVLLPNISTLQARVKVQCSNNIFFDISNVNFRIDPAATNPPLFPDSLPASAQKNRYISIAPNNVGIVAFRVDLAAGPGTLGTVGWLDAPADLSCPGACTGELVSRIVDSPVYRLWLEPVVHISDCEVVPAATYHILATQNGVLFSSPLIAQTTPAPFTKHWGDVSGLFNGVSWNEPDGFANVNDVLAVVSTVAGAAGAPPRSWTDLHPETPNYLVNVADVQQAVFGAIGYVYSYVAPSGCP